MRHVSRSRAVGAGTAAASGARQKLSQQSSGPVTLQYGTWFPAQSTFQKVIDAYEKANPSITIALHAYSNMNYREQLPLALHGGRRWTSRVCRSRR
jgi:ABC-type glycerol-3-phosphate transport system substrate-binding protein